MDIKRVCIGIGFSIFVFFVIFCALYKFNFRRQQNNESLAFFDSNESENSTTFKVCLFVHLWFRCLAISFRVNLIYVSLNKYSK